MQATPLFLYGEVFNFYKRSQSQPSLDWLIAKARVTTLSCEEELS